MRRLVLAFMLLLAWSVSAQDLVLPVEPPFVERKVLWKEMVAARKAKKTIFAHLFGERAGTISRFNRLDHRFVRAGSVIRVPQLPDDARDYTPMPASYFAAAGIPKAILILLDRQFLGAYENGLLVASYPISSGRTGHETPAGLFKVKKKDADHVSSVYPEETGGGWPMPHALRFYRSEYWIHGGDLKGYPDSHGCVRLFPEDAEKLFEWTPIGTPVRVVPATMVVPNAP